MKHRVLLKDGLYYVEKGGISAGFVVRGGEVVACAPVLKRGLDFWIKHAQYVCADPKRKHEYDLSQQTN